MQDAELLRYGRYMTSLIAAVVLNKPTPEPFDGIDWVLLYKLAKKHDSATIIYEAIENLELPEEARRLFVNNKNKVIARTTRQAIEADRVMGEFEKHNIKYIRLKGIHIKDYYPKPYMRIFSDVDLYVSKEDREEAKGIMAYLGYELKSTIDYHDEYEKDNFFIYEIHNPLISKNSFHHNIFTSPFNKSIAINETYTSYRLNNEFLYLHLLFHLYGHFLHCGCGVRFFTDLLVFKQYTDNVDYEFINSTLDEYGLKDFRESVSKLIDFFFYNSTADNDVLTIAGYIFDCKTIESFSNDMANLSFWDKSKYVLSVWFPPAKVLSAKYPVLNKAPILLPVCWIRRIFHSLFFNHAAIKQQAKEVKELNSNKFKKIKKARNLAIKKK